MIVISLIVLAAAQLSRRGQRQTLDRQLSTQAFYAAESGVNDAVKAIEGDLAASGTLIDIDYVANCGGFIAATSLNPDLGGGVKYSCLLVDPTPTTWEGTVGDSTSRTTPLRDKNGGAISSVTISWQANDGNSDFSTCGANFDPEATRTCKTPILRFDLVPTTTTTRAALNANVMTGFLVPASAGSSSFAFAPSQVAIKQTIACSSTNTPKYCKATITMASPQTGYYLRIKSVYGSSSVTVSAQDAATNKYELKDAQIVIDSTGKANDVLRRIQVRVPFSGALDIPEFAIQSGDTICKQLTVSGGTATPANAEAACQP
jgi:hypothetical protein